MVDCIPARFTKKFADRVKDLIIVLIVTFDMFPTIHMESCLLRVAKKISSVFAVFLKVSGQR
jgi:hypothetical protein